MIVVVKDVAQAKIAEEHGARAVLPVEKAVSKDSPMTDLGLLKDIMDQVTVPVIARVRLGQEMEARILEQSCINIIEENEIMKTGFDHIVKHPFSIPFIAEAGNLVDILSRINHGASMIRTPYPSNEEGSDITETYNRVKSVMSELKLMLNFDENGIANYVRQHGVNVDLVRMTIRQRSIPVPFFAAGNVFMPVDVAMLMELGCDGVFISARVFDTIAPETRMKDIANALKNHSDPAKMATIIERTGGYSRK
ncbi:hypothetical protein H4R18_005607 [Coemansia javaensis]|uniref:pyridoxal 5'-phosphate synthase (glutamine hydrolyzing) n=1 Tax=Coemansia javaensis TaxID=2761396 RepID=A0A9W8LE16_9FUNG|nr:hypothetical protein H4R18_005607 [Coemansia javaensis]